MKNETMITVTLSNGLSARIPFKNWKSTLAKLEENIKRDESLKNISNKNNS